MYVRIQAYFFLAHMVLVSVGCMVASLGVFVNFYRDTRHQPNDHQFLLFDCGVYASIAAVVCGIITTTLAGVALGYGCLTIYLLVIVMQCVLRM